MHVQLKRAKTLCAKRMQYCGGSEYSCYVDSNEVPLEKKVCVLFVSFNFCLHVSWVHRVIFIRTLLSVIGLTICSLVFDSQCRGGSVAEWLACWTQARKGPGTNRSHDADAVLRKLFTPIVPLYTKQQNW